jgi:LysW-gamma-L-lysine carboxypeptidase
VDLMTNPALYVLKVGSGSLGQRALFEEIGELARSGARVLLVAGGAAGIAEHYAAIGRQMPTVTLKSGDTARYSPPEELAHILAAYRQVTLPLVRSELARVGVDAFALPASDSGLVTGRRNKPLRTVVDGKERIVRDHRAGVVSHVDGDRLRALLTEFGVVCLCPPVADEVDGQPLNVDADMLAAALAVAVQADHLRLVTGTAGLLTDPADPASTLPDAHPGEAGQFAGGRMRQKVRAAELALTGPGDVAITGPHSFAPSAGRTRFWRGGEPGQDLALLSRAVQVPSVSGDESQAAALLVDWCRERSAVSGVSVDARVDAVGNFVATRGDGPHRLLLLGHLDTVPFTWPAQWADGELTGRGTVDAKGSLVNFVQALLDADLPDGVQLRVVGAVEEEISSSRGAFYARDHYPADAVVVGEPSGASRLTLGYYGLFKLRITCTETAGHSAGKEVLTAPDAVLDAVAEIREAVLKQAPEALSALIDVRHAPGRAAHLATAMLNFRLPPTADHEGLRSLVGGFARPDLAVEVLRCTPGAVFGRGSTVARAFARSFAAEGIRPRYLVKKGTSDMNTLATTWQGVPMVAYGPGDSTLDHTEHERISAAEYRQARTVLAGAIQHWISLVTAP